MKGSLKLRPRRVLNRKEAWGCFIANLALPGSGSLAAGYAIGYGQMVAAFFAEIFSCVTGIPLILWMLSGAGGALTAAGGSFDYLTQFWSHVCWPLAGIALFAVSVLWAMATSLTILSHASKDGVPPRIV